MLHAVALPYLEQLCSSTIAGLSMSSNSSQSWSMPSTVEGLAVNFVLDFLETVTEEPLVEVTENSSDALIEIPRVKPVSPRGKLSLASAVTSWPLLNECSIEIVLDVDVPFSYSAVFCCV